jgi:hypothetical protein
MKAKDRSQRDKMPTYWRIICICLLWFDRFLYIPKIISEVWITHVDVYSPDEVASDQEMESKNNKKGKLKVDKSLILRYCDTCFVITGFTDKNIWDRIKQWQSSSIDDNIELSFLVKNKSTKATYPKDASALRLVKRDLLSSDLTISSVGLNGIGSADESTDAIPVTTNELFILRRFIQIFRASNFLRYQARASAKILTSCTLLLVPLLSLTVDTSGFAGYPRDTTTSDTAIDSRYVILISLFLATDVLEWITITFYCQLSTDDLWHQNLSAFRNTLSFPGLYFLSKPISDQRNIGSIPSFHSFLFQPVFLFCLTYCIYYGAQVLSNVWDPWNIAKIRDETGIDEIDYRHILQICPI